MRGALLGISLVLSVTTACIGDGCSGRLAADNAAQRFAAALFSHPLPPGAMLVERRVTAGVQAYGRRARPGTCAIGARQTIASSAALSQVSAHFARAYVPRLMIGRSGRRQRARVRVERRGRDSSGRTLYRITTTDCCHDFGSVCGR